VTFALGDGVNLAGENPLKICIWGARGSIPTPQSSAEVAEKITDVLWSAQGRAFSDKDAAAQYVSSLPMLQTGTVGGNTACVEVRKGDDLLILDAGSGIRPLGLKLMQGPCGKGKGVVHLLMNHTHWDHMIGFPFFAPAYVPGNRIIIYGVHDRLRERFEIQQNPLHFPVPLDAMPSEKIFKNIQEGEPFSIGSLKIRTKELKHPGKAYAYRIEDETGSFVYATDAEYQNLGRDAMQPFMEFFSGADILIFDSQYTFHEAMQKEDWGHSSSLIGVDIAIDAGVRHFLMFHHEPTYKDKKIADLLSETRRYRRQAHPDVPLTINLAYEGMCLDPSEDPVELNF
ncbi:MAG: MBL fold metallo-hydrolase, partial [bacterium]